MFTIRRVFEIVSIDDGYTVKVTTYRVFFWVIKYKFRVMCCFRWRDTGHVRFSSYLPTIEAHLFESREAAQLFINNVKPMLNLLMELENYGA